MCHSSGTPADMLDKCLDFTKEEFDTEDKVKDKYIKDFISASMPTKGMNDYIWNWFAYVLSGDRSEHQFVNFIGTGRNGKSAFVQLLKAALGPYCVSPSIKLITQNKGQLEAPSPVISGCRGALLVSLSEPDPEVFLQVGVLKQLTGDDSVMARFLRRNPQTFKWNAAILVPSNKEMPFVDNTKAIEARARIVPWPFSFDAYKDEKDTLSKQGDPKYGSESEGLGCSVS